MDQIICKGFLSQQKFAIKNYGHKPFIILCICKSTRKTIPWSLLTVNKPGIKVEIRNLFQTQLKSFPATTAHSATLKELYSQVIIYCGITSSHKKLQAQMLLLSGLTSALIPQGFNISPPVVNLSNLFSSAEGKICKVMLAGPRIFPCPQKLESKSASPQHI